MSFTSADCHPLGLRHSRRLSVGSCDAMRQQTASTSAVTTSRSDRPTTGSDDADSNDETAGLARRLRLRRHHSQSAFNKWNLVAALSFNVDSSASTSSTSFSTDVAPQMSQKTRNVSLVRSQSLTSYAAKPETDTDSSRSGRLSTSLSPQTSPRVVIPCDKQQQRNSGTSSDNRKHRGSTNGAIWNFSHRAADCSRSTSKSAENSDGSGSNVRHADCSSLPDNLREESRPLSDKSSADPDDESFSGFRVSHRLSPRNAADSNWIDRSSLFIGSRPFDVDSDDCQSDRHLLNIDMLRHHVGLHLNASAAAAAAAVAMRSTPSGCYDLLYPQLPSRHRLIQPLQPSSIAIGGTFDIQFATVGSHSGFPPPVDSAQIFFDPEASSRKLYGNSRGQLPSLPDNIGGTQPESNICLYFRIYY
jgi:hypothetical protein